MAESERGLGGEGRGGRGGWLPGGDGGVNDGACSLLGTFNLVYSWTELTVR